MKAWIVDCRCEFDSSMIIVYAETRGRAKSTALEVSERWQDMKPDFVDIRARREKSADKWYKKGKLYLDWYKKEDRIHLCDLGWTCGDSATWELCNSCPAKSHCDMFEEMKSWITSFGEG